MQLHYLVSSNIYQVPGTRARVSFSVSRSVSHHLSLLLCGLVYIDDITSNSTSPVLPGSTLEGTFSTCISFTSKNRPQYMMYMISHFFFFFFLNLASLNFIPQKLHSGVYTCANINTSFISPDSLRRQEAHDGVAVRFPPLLAPKLQDPSGSPPPPSPLGSGRGFGEGSAVAASLSPSSALGCTAAAVVHVQARGKS